MVIRHGIWRFIVINIINLRYSTGSSVSNRSFSEIATTAASGTSHWRFDNVHKPTMLKLAIPGSISAFIGAGVLTFIHGDYIKPFIALFLLSMGFYILYQFLFKRAHEHHHHVGDLSSFKVIPQGFVAGFLDAIGGGGWGPVNTPLLLSSKNSTTICDWNSLSK